MADVLEQFLAGGKTETPPAKPSASPSASQSKRQIDAMAILQDELDKAQKRASSGDQRAARDVESLQREIALRNKTTKKSVPSEPTAQPTSTAQTAPVSSDPLEAFLSGQTTQAVSAQPTVADQNVPAKTQQIKQKYFGKNISPTDVINLSTTIPEEAQSDLRPIYEVPRAIVQNLAASIASGYGAIAKGVQTGSLQEAGKIQKEIQEKYGYEPNSPVSKKVLEILNLPVEYVLQPAAKFAGDVVQSATGSPTAGGVVAGSLETAPMLLGLRKSGTQPGVTAQISALERQKAAMNDPNLPPSVRAAIADKTAKGEVMTPDQIKTMQTQFEASKATLPQQVSPTAATTAATAQGTQQAQKLSLGAAAVPDAVTIQQALSVATPELQAALKGKKLDTSFIRHIEADSLDIPIRLTEGQSTGDIIKISNEQNRRGKDPDLARRFNEQNGLLIENLNSIRDKAAPDVFGTKTIENSQGIIDAYKSMDANLNQGINAKYQALRDAAGGQFPVDAPKLLQNVEAKLRKELLSNEAPKGQFSELQRLAKENNMTFEDYLSLRRNLGEIARTAKDGAERKAASYMIEELEKLPLQDSAKRLKPLADQARKAARDRFQMLEKDPAFKAAVDDSVPADKYINKFVINGVNKNIQTMVNNLGRDSLAHQHMAAGTVNWLKDKTGIIDEKSNFSQKQYNEALKKLDDVNNLQEIFNGESASKLKTLGNVANYTQFQPRGAFVNNSNTLVGSMAENARNLVGKSVEGSLNLAVPGVQLGTSLMEMRARRAAEAETRKALELGAGTRKQ
jgi:hypothetical protein